MTFEESWGIDNFLEDPEGWINSHRFLIEETERKLRWETDPEKIKILHDEITWRKTEIDILQSKLAS